MSSVKPGNQVGVTLLRGANRETIKAETRACPDNLNRAAFGIQVSDKYECDIPGMVTSWYGCILYSTRSGLLFKQELRQFVKEHNFQSAEDIDPLSDPIYVPSLGRFSDGYFILERYLMPICAGIPK